jgi:hypothetical protein
MMQQDMALNFSPDIPEDMADLVMEGFEGLPRVSVPNEEGVWTAARSSVPTLCMPTRRVTWTDARGSFSVNIDDIYSARMWDFDGLFELVIGTTPDHRRVLMWKSPLAMGSKDRESERRFQESCGQIINAVSAAQWNRYRDSVHAGEWVDNRCVTGPPDDYPTTDTWKLSHIESRGHIWGTETSIDAPEVLAAGSVVAFGWTRPSIPMANVFYRPGRAKSGADDRRQPGGIQ